MIPLTCNECIHFSSFLGPLLQKGKMTISNFIFPPVIFEGKRFSLPNSRIMIHQPLGGFQGGQTDIDIQVYIGPVFFPPHLMAQTSCFF